MYPVATAEIDLNKTTKIWLNYVIGGCISLLLLWGIWLQVQKQLSKVDWDAVWVTGPIYLLIIAIALMPLNLLLEAKKWHLLAGSAQPLTYRQALSSYFAGIAVSLVTPNRIGEYPGRLLYLKRKNTIRLVGVSILGALNGNTCGRFPKSELKLGLASIDIASGISTGLKFSSISNQ